MNDADWIRLLSEQSPRELSDDEIAALRQRIEESPAVRQAARDSLQLEQTLSAGLGAVNLSAEDLLQRVLQRGRAPEQSGQPAWWRWIGLTAGTLLLLAASVWYLRFGSTPRGLDDAASDVAVIDANPADDVGPETVTPSVEQLPNVADNPDAVSAVGPTNLTPVPLKTPLAEPWAEWIAPQSRPLAADNPRLVGDLRAIGHDELSLAEFRRWWDDVPNQRAGLNQDQIGNRRTVHLQGWAKLRAPWLADTQLRLTPFDIREITLFFWTGDSGIALRFYRNREPHLWTAFEVHRKPGESTPDRWGLLTTDNGSFYHSGAATLEVAVESGRLVLSTGQTPVLTVSMNQLPTDVLMSAESRLRGFSWLRVAPREFGIKDAEPTVFGDEPPSAWSWRIDQAAQAMLQRDADGGVTLTGTSQKDVARVYVPLDRPELYETLIQVAAADPGTGVYLGDKDGKPIGQLAFFKDRRTSQTTFGFLRPNERRFDSDFDDRSQPPPYFVPSSWLRVVSGLGIWNTWSSGDGEHWGHLLENPIRDVNGAVRSVGLYCLPSETPRTIRLQRLDVRPLSAVMSLANGQQLNDITQEVETWPRSFEDWLQLAWDKKPLGVAAPEWCDTCAVAALQQGPPRELANALLDRLVTSARDRGHTSRELLRLLDECLVLTDQWHDQDSARWARHYAAVGLNAGNDPDGLGAWTSFLQAPRWTHRVERGPFQQRIAGDLIAASYRDDWTTVRQTSRRAAFDVSPGHPDHQPRDGGEVLDRIARWSRGYAAESRTGTPESTDDAVPVSWRHPAQWPVNKEAYNVSAELQAALSTGAYRDAGRIVTSLTGGESLGLLPDRRDPALLISLPIALEAAQRDDPAFAAALRDEFGELGRLRVAQAIDNADAGTLQSAALQFLSTPAGADAERWLGDQRTAVGDFLAAGLHYRRALRWASANQSSELSARLALAVRLTGSLPGETATPLGSQQLAGYDVQTLVPKLSGDVATFPAPTMPGALIPTTIPIQRYRLDRKARFDGQTGQNAGRGEYRDSDPFGRQFGIAADAERVYLSNRFQVTAYRRSNQERQWATAVGGEQGEAHAHRFTAMTPVVVGDRVFVRRLTKTSIELACLDAASGTEKWTHQPGPNAAVLSDPVWAAGRLFAVVGQELEQDLWDLRWTQFDAGTGKPTASTSVLRLRNAWDKEVPCQLAVRATQVVIAAGGVTGSFDLKGTVQWIRRELWLPPRIDPLQYDHFALPPVLTENTALVAQPNVRTVQCLDRQTGRRLWNRPLPRLQGMIAMHEPFAFAAEPERLTAIDTATGAVLWQTPLEGWLGPLAVDDNRVAVLRRETRKGNQGWLTLTWLDSATGRVLADSSLDAEEKDEWRVGPWFALDGGLWALSESGIKTAHRDLSVLTPIADSYRSLSPSHDAGLGPWSATPSAEIRHATQIVLPGWQPILSNRESLEFVANEIQGERGVLRTKVSKGRGLSFGRTVSLREDDMPVLQFRVGREGDAAWTLVIRADNQILHEQVVDAQTAPNGWCDVRLPLGAFNGQTVLLQMQQRPVGDRAGLALWKSAEVISE
ncbi:MAG TPA: PQQ-binding-like beta-propeller repeat protein [Planctomycetaceae bacterium]|nr:PQQ-binding-like beta-propeller repeat protein [Planctomycetaceae bacterium]